MFSFATFVLSAALVVLADPAPTVPAPGQVFQQGSSCQIGWTPDQTGIWKTMNIELMTGDNINMIHLSTVATSVDGTTSPSTFSYPCLAVTPPAPVYFYQFSSPSSPNKTWTGRFTISDSTGNTVPAPNATQPDGEAVPWGTGSLVDPSKAVPPPSYLNGGNSSTNGTSAMPPSGTRSVVSSTSAAAMPPFVSPSGFVTTTTTGSSPVNTNTGNASTSSGANSGGALVLGAVSARAAQAGVALAVIAGTFTFLV